MTGEAVVHRRRHDTEDMVRPEVPGRKKSVEMSQPFETLEAAFPPSNNDPPWTTFRDHASLPAPGSMIRFRSSAMVCRVYNDPLGQFVIEDDIDEDGRRIITTKRLETRTAGLMALRCIYTLVCVFFSGFLLALSIEILLYQVLDLAIELGVTSKGDLHIGTAIGAFLALPVYVHGLACAMVIAVHFIEDTFAGHTLVKRFVFGRTSGVIADWCIFIVYLGIPLIVMVVTLFSGLVNWWEVTSLVWFSLMTMVYIIFAAAVVGIENLACFEVTRNRYDHDDDRWHQIVRRSMLMRQRHMFGGMIHTTYLAKGAIDTVKGKARGIGYAEASRRDYVSPYSKFIAMPWLSTDGGLGLFRNLDEPVRIYTLQDVKNERPFITVETWSLESLFCRPNQARYIGVFKGPQALTEAQMRSSLICAVIGNSLIILLVASLLVWLGLHPAYTIILIILMAVFFVVPGFMRAYRIYLMTQDFMDAVDATNEETGDQVDAAEAGPLAEEENCECVEDEGGKNRSFELSENESQGVYQVWESYRITTLTERTCWIIFGMEVVFLFLWPLISLYSIGNNATGTLFLFVALFSAARAYFNAAIVLEETGTLDLVDGEKDSRKHWLNMSRLSIVVTKITRSRGRILWMSVLSFILVALLGLFGLAVTQQNDTASDFQFTYLPDFEYVPTQDLKYPTCSLGKQLPDLGSARLNMSDVAFLAILAYRDTNITQHELDQWYGEGVAYDNQTYVDAFRNETDTWESAVSFKLITFPNFGNSAMISIRGTTNGWDALTDAQLWSAAAMFQGLRYMLPAGDIWTPIMFRLINIISWLASDSINQISFYRETTAFAKRLLQSGQFGNVQVTGHSLGGGLSIITGAQAGIIAGALSGPNAMLSRQSFDPPLEAEALDNSTFNIIPDRDIVPRLDDVAQLNQQISCTADVNDFIGCHDGRRSLCEIIYNCGTGQRPALCDCVYEFFYPEPTPKKGTNRTFAEACAGWVKG